MTICVDIDDTICDLQQTVIELFNARYGTSYVLDDFKEYNIMNTLSLDEATTMKKIYEEPYLYNLVKPFDGAQDALQKLVNAGHQVYLVSDAIPKTYGEKVEFVHRYFPFIDDAHIVAMKHKWNFRCDVMVEDNMSNLLAKPYYYRVCYDRPWNRAVHDEVYDIHRCTDWSGILDVVNKLSEEE